MTTKTTSKPAKNNVVDKDTETDKKPSPAQTLDEMRTEGLFDEFIEKYLEPRFYWTFVDHEDAIDLIIKSKPVGINPNWFDGQRNTESREVRFRQFEELSNEYLVIAKLKAGDEQFTLFAVVVG